MKINYHDLPEGFFKSMVVRLLSSDIMKDHGIFEEISRRSYKFTELDLKISMNGVEVNPENLFENLAAMMSDSVKREASNIVNGLDPLRAFREAAARIERDLNSAQFTVRAHLEQALAKVGIELSFDD